LLADDYEVIAVDLPDHGESPDLPPGYRGDIAPLADALEEFLAAIGVERPHVVGNSLGGLIALELAGRGTARTATALSPAGFWSPAEALYARAVLGGAAATLRRMSPETLRAALDRPALRKALLGAIMAHPEEHESEELAADLGGLHRPRAAFPGMLAELADWELPAPSDVPTVVGWGTRDRLLFPRQFRRLREVLPDAEIYSLPGLGHVPMGDDPRVVADLIRYAVAR
jgi:pimeloyl-ACP methyl ester carboxylesterase